MAVTSLRDWLSRVLWKGWILFVSFMIFILMCMTVSQLLVVLIHLSEHGHAEDEVRVPVYEQGCMLGPRPSSSVVSVSPGVDWDSGVVFLNTEDILIKS